MDYTKVHIRRLETKDIQKVGEIVNRSMLPSLKGCPYELIQQRLALNNSNDFLNDRETSEYFVAVKDKIILGIIGLDVHEINIFYVDPKYQRHGVGKMLYEKIFDLVDKRKIPKLIVKSTISAQSLYEALGFTFVERIWGAENGRKSFTILMQKNITHDLKEYRQKTYGVIGDHLDH